MKRILTFVLFSIAFFNIVAVPASFPLDKKPFKATLKPVEKKKSTIFHGITLPYRGLPLPGDDLNLTAPIEYLANTIVKIANPPKEEPEKKVHEVKVLKEAEIERIGAEAAYEEFAGLRFGKYFTVAQRVEIFQEAKPIDTYILDAKAIRTLGQGGKLLEWDTKAHFRSQIQPQFTRAYGTQFTMDNPDDKSGQITQLRYTLDYRDIYKQYYPKYTSLQVERWLQDEFLFIHSMKLYPLNWYYTLNAGYRFSNIAVQFDDSANEVRHTYIGSLAIAPHPQFEWFGKFEYYKSKRIKSDYPYSPDHFYWRTECRMKSSDQKTSLIPSLSYSVDYYWPFKNVYKKYELSAKLGHDFNNRLSGTTQLDYVLGLRDEPDNTAPTYARPNPYQDKASWAGTKNRVSYNFWNKFYLQAGVDYSLGIDMSVFDNVGTFLGLEYYKPGVLRANFGSNTNYYYKIDDWLNTIGFKVYIFM